MFSGSSFPAWLKITEGRRYQTSQHFKSAQLFHKHLELEVAAEKQASENHERLGPFQGKYTLKYREVQTKTSQPADSSLLFFSTGIF